MHRVGIVFATGSDSSGRYVHWGVVQVSVTNLVIVGLMVALFVLALVLPFPGSQRGQETDKPSGERTGPRP